MAFKNLNAFGAGEITPELDERGNLDKFRTGLRALRNATVTKMGGVRSRAGTIKVHSTKDGSAAKFIYIQAKNYLLEFTTNNLRLYTGYEPDFGTFTSPTNISLSGYAAGADITKMHFTYGNKYVFLFSEDNEMVRIDLDKVVSDPSNALSTMRALVAPPNPWFLSSTFNYTASGAPSGYDVDYAVTFVFQGVETFTCSWNQTLKKPAGVSQYNEIVVATNSSSWPAGTTLPPDEVRIYQRPRNGGGYLYIGSVLAPTFAGTTYTFTFRDYGVSPVSTDFPPEYVSQFVTDTKQATVTPGEFYYRLTPKTGLVYQDRLIFSGSRSKNLAFGTKTGTTAMSRDFPLQADSAVSFKTGSDGGLRINRFFDGRGLLVFTTVGVYETPSVSLTPETAYAIKRAPYVAADNIEAVQLGGFITIYDERLRAVIGLTPSGTYDGFSYNEFSIYSSHLFKDKRIVSWALEDAETQVLWIVLDDGTAVSFSFQDEQQVRSWARHDSQDGLIEEVFVMDVQGGKDIVFFSINRNGTRYVERMSDRSSPFLDYVGSDSSVLYKSNLMAEAVVLNATITPVTPGEWDDALVVAPSGGGFFSATIGEIFRIYTNGPWEYVDLTVVAIDIFLGTFTAMPNAEYPSTQPTVNIAAGIWRVYKTLTGLSHLNGKKVSVRIDGFTHASPLNTERDYDEYTVSGGLITLPEEAWGAVISVGLPIVTDIGTLALDTVEQSPTKLEGKICNNLWLSYFESLFLFAGSSFPEDDTVTGMDMQEFQVETDGGILNTIPPLPITEDPIEMQIQGDWKVQGRISLRNVDPQPIGLRAIIPDYEVIRK